DEKVVYGDGCHKNPESEIRNPKLKLKLPPGRAQGLEIQYTANSFVEPERVRFQYRLDGHDTDWRHDEANKRVAFYSNLRPGSYTFRVKACNNHGYWNEVGDSFAFSLAPRVTQTIWFPVSCAFGL